METLSTIERATRFGRMLGGTAPRRAAGASPFGCCGIFLILMSTSLLFWNEGRSVRRYSILYEGAKAVREVTNINHVDPANEGKLVHLVGTTKNDRIVKDTMFGVEEDAIKLARNVFMYQWQEHREPYTVTNPDGSTSTKYSYNYDKVWYPAPINSNAFNKSADHVNPGPLPYKQFYDTTDKVTIGAYQATKDMMDQDMNWFSYKTDGISVDKITDPDAKRKAQAITGGFYFGNNPAYPQIGDAKMEFRVVLNAKITIMAQQSGNSFVPYKGKHAGKDGQLMFVELGEHTAQEIFAREVNANKFETWAFRFLGVLIMYFGVGGMLSPFAMVLHSTDWSMH